MSSDRTTLMGITLTLDDGATLTLGTIGPEKEDIQHLGGPIHGIKWTYTDVVTSVQLGFNSCYCKIEAAAFTSPVVLGVSEEVVLTGKSLFDPSPFDASADSCLTGTK